MLEEERIRGSFQELGPVRGGGGTGTWLAGAVLYRIFRHYR